MVAPKGDLALFWWRGNFWMLTRSSGYLLTECDRKVWCFRTMWAELGLSSVLRWLLINHTDGSETAKELRTPQSQRLSRCQKKTRSVKETVRLPLFLSSTSAFKIRWLKNEVMNLITDLSEIAHLNQTAATLVCQKSSLPIKKKIITMNENAWQM